MNIFVTGGTGFVGKTLLPALAGRGYDLTVLTRSPDKATHLPSGIALLKGDPTEAGSWQEKVSDHDVVINLAGASIFRRWTRKAKEIIRDSRIMATRNLTDALSKRKVKDTLLINASAVGYYGFRGNEEIDETGKQGDDFLASVAGLWEKTALEAKNYGARVVICRFGIVLGTDGGALAGMIPLFKKGLGSPLGNGKQWMSWIHEQDLADIFPFLIGQRDISGEVNCTSPQPVRNEDFTKALAEALGKPILLPRIPGFLIKLMKGEFGSVLLKGQRVVPKILIEKGFHFQFPTVTKALSGLHV